MLRACLFDVDGVLIQSEWAHEATWMDLAREQKLTLSEQEVHARTQGHTLVEGLKNLFGQDISARQLAEFSARKEALFRERFDPPRHLTPGVMDFLEALHAKRIKIAFVTNTSRVNLNPKLLGTGLPELADTIVTADEVKRGKPDPEMYLLAAARLGALPGECLIFEDAVPGIKAAQAAGIKVVLLRAEYNRSVTDNSVAKVIGDFRGMTMEYLRGL